MNNQQESKNIKLNNSDFSFLANQKSWLKIPADGSPLTFTGNADEAAKEFFSALIRVRDGYISALKAERDALEVRLRNALTSEQEAVQRAHAANQTADALAMESAALKAAVDLIASAYTEGEPAGFEIDRARHIETPTTDSALAAIEARGVEKLIKLKMEQLASMHPDTHAFGATAESLRAQINELQAFATELREAK